MKSKEKLILTDKKQSSIFFNLGKCVSFANLNIGATSELISTAGSRHFAKQLYFYRRKLRLIVASVA